MNSIRRFLRLSAAMFGIAVGTGAKGQMASVDPQHPYQRFEGWGVSLCWSGKVVGGFPDAVRNEYADRMFDPVKGLGFNIARYNIGGGENPRLHFLGYREGIPGYEPAPGQWDWAADAGQRWLLDSAKVRGANLFEAFANSPPYWMTASGSVTGKDKTTNNLAPEHEQDFADYLVEVVDHFHRAWGITFRTLDPLNEPDAAWWTYGRRQEGCRFDPPAQARLIQAVGRSLERKGSPTQISASDENSIDTAINTFTSFDPGVRSLIAQLNTHSYAGRQRAKLASMAAASRKRLWMSEYGDNDPSGMKLAEQILSDLNGLHPAAWIYWQALDNPKWALLANAEDGHDTTYQVTKKYWVLANYTRFIRPGALFIDSGDEHTVAAWDAAGRALTLVSVNPGNTDVTMTYDLTRLNAPESRVASWRTSASEDLAMLPEPAVREGRFLGALPARSVTTFVVSMPPR